jgi:hypothetical protein
LFEDLAISCKYQEGREYFCTIGQFQPSSIAVRKCVWVTWCAAPAAAANLNFTTTTTTNDDDTPMNYEL